MIPDATPRRATDPDADACRTQLRRIVESQDFDASDRDRRFLAYVVDEALAGRADRIKAYSIATEVFGRDSAFDPQTDPIVRVEAGHLRRALDRYYLTAGRDDPVVIAVPKGGYAPTFSMRTRETPAPDPAAAVAPAGLSSWMRLGLAGGIAGLALAGLALFWLARPAPPPDAPDVPRLAVTTIEALGDDPEVGRIAEGLTAELIGEIARFRDIVVVVPPSERAVAPRYALDGTIARGGTDLRVQLQLRRVADGAVVWAEGYSAHLATEQPLEAEARIAGAAATAIGQAYGAVFRADAGDRAGRASTDADAYACTLAYFDFRSDIDLAGYEATRTCLEAAVARFPQYATAWGLLAEIRIDGLRWGLDPTADLGQALQEARRALAIDPTNVRALQAKMMALYLSGDFSGALRVGAAAVATNPNDTEVLGEYGYRLAVSGNWDEGCPLIESAVARNPGPLAYYETGLALCAYIAGNPTEAAARIRAAPFPQVAIYHLMAAAFFAEAGEMEAAHRERDWLLAEAPGLLANLGQRVASRVGRPEDYARFLGSLRRAGIPVPDQAAGSDQPSTPG